jgi:serine/threonine-protein kinase
MGDEAAADAGSPAGIEGGLAVGARVGGYRLERPLGRGGMAAVYLARDERLDRLVALKIMAPALAADQEFRTRFIRESRAAAAVDHPHIIPVYEAGDADGLLFIAMRYVPGGDVGTIVRREGPLSLGRAAAVIAQVASALDAAHAAGLVHRDVKPANMLADSGPSRADHVYLSDFGLSKKILAASAGLTGTGRFLGTLDYVAPEQIQGRPADGRTDQYGLACAAFDLLTGAPPFQREEAAALLYAHLSDPPPLVGSRRDDLPAGLDPVLARALAKAPADRYPSCQAFADAMLQALGTAPHRSPLAVSQPAADHPPIPAAPVGGRPVPSVAAAAGTARSPHAPADPPTQDADIPAPAAAADTVAPAPQAAPALAPTAGQRVPGPDADPGPSARDDDQRRPAPGPAPQLLTATATAAAPRSAGPSSSRTPRSRGRLWLFATAATAVIAAGVTALTVSLSGGAGRQPTAPGTHPPASQPTSRPAASGPVTDSLAATLKNPKYQPIGGVAFGSGARTLAVGSIDIHAAKGATYLWATATRSITATLTDPASKGVNSVAFAPNGTTLAVGDGNGRTYLWDTATGQITATLTGPGVYGAYSVAFAPDGTTLAVGSINADGTAGATYLWDTATGTRTATLTDPASHSPGANSVAFAPGGTTLAIGDEDGSIYLWDTATGTRTATLTDPGSYGVFSVAFAPGGTTLAAGDGNGHAYLWDTATDKLTATLTDPGSKGGSSVAFAPGGTTLAVGDANGHIYLWDTATGQITATLTDPGSKGVFTVAFAPGGTTLAASDRNGSTYLWNIARPAS